MTVHRRHPRRVGLLALLATAAVLLVVAFSGCGGSSKPSYCSDVSNFKSAVKGLTNVQVTENGISSLTTAVGKVQSAGTKLVNDAKSNFSAETNALSASLSALATTAKQLTDPQTRSAALKQVPLAIAAVSSSFNSLSDATKSKCS